MLANMLWQGSCVLAETPGLVDYFNQSDLAGKGVVVVLFILSFIGWTIMIGKYLELKRLRELNHALESRLYEVPSLLSLTVKNKGEGQGSYGRMLAAGIDAYQEYRAGKEGKVGDASKPIELVQNALQRVLAEQSLRYESKMIFLGSIVSGAPFIGLLGTVWGVMDAFGAVAMQNSATIQSLAPGVSGALLATLAGLLVAIPAVFGYNYLLTLSKVMVTELENFASTLADRMQLELDQMAQ